MSHSVISRANHSIRPSQALKNALMAIVMMLFLAISFKLAGEVSSDTLPVISQTDTVVSTLNQPANSHDTP
ncbi:MAG: hypothetical protein ACRC7U_03660 [Moraxella sp.]|jgi:hypothetical protein